MSYARWLVVALLMAAVLAPPTGAQDKKNEKKDLPVLILANPLGIPLGATTKLTLRGQKLDEATEVRAVENEAGVKLVSKGKAPINQQEASLSGDSQIVVEVTLPAEMADPLLSLVAVNAQGESKPLAILVGGDVIAEQEPNPGFKQSQPVTCPATIAGQIQNNQDVDVFRYTAQAGERLVIEVQARQLGSALDGTLAVHDEKGRLVASSDDREDARDPRLEVAFDKAGVYYISLLDAQDQGGPAHPYRLVIRRP